MHAHAVGGGPGTHACGLKVCFCLHATHTRGPPTTPLSQVLAAAVRAGADPDAYGTVAVTMKDGHAPPGAPPRRGFAAAARPPKRARVLVAPLHLAALQLDVASVAALLAAGADPNAQARMWIRREFPYRGRLLGTPLHFVASASPVEWAPQKKPRGGSGGGGRDAPQQPDIVQWRVAAIVELLMRHGADLGATTGQGAPAVEVACGAATALPWGRRRSPAAVYILRAAARSGLEAVRTARLQMARRVLQRSEAEQQSEAEQRPEAE
jgi:hypothetical protein